MRRRRRNGTVMTIEHHNVRNKLTITTEEQIIINVKYLEWLYAKSRERKKQTKELLDTRGAIELVIRDGGGEKALKTLFLMEQDDKTIYELARLNPIIAEMLEQDRGVGLEALNDLIADIVRSD